MAKRVPTYQPMVMAKVRRAYEASPGRKADKLFYKSSSWRRCRESMLATSPLCADCLAREILTPALPVHHIQERKDRPDLAYEPDNLQALCAACHNAKRTRE